MVRSSGPSAGAILRETCEAVQQFYMHERQDKARVSLVEITSAPGLAFSLAAAYLQAYAEGLPCLAARYHFNRLVSYGGQGVDGIVQDICAKSEQAGRPDVLAFTIYFWNRQTTWQVIARLRKVWPGVVIVVGGTDIEPETTEPFVCEKLADFVCFGEGEQVFAEVLQDLAEVAQAGRDRAGLPRFRRARNQIDPLDQVPSPFLTGIVSADEVAAAGMIIFETNRGCPFLCSFCYWGGAVGSKVRRFSPVRIRDEIRFLLTHMRSGATLFLADANFGMHALDIEFAEVLGSEVRRSGKKLLLFVNWAKNTTNRVLQAARILFEHDLIGAVTLSAQSLTPAALEACGRKNIPYDQYLEMHQRFRALGIPTYTELILGLPPESLDEFYSGIEKVLQGGGHPVIYPLLLLRNTELAGSEMRARWGLDVARLPYQFVGSGGATVETVIGHDRLSRADWRDAMAFALTMALIYHVFARETVLSACRFAGLPLVRGLRTIQDALCNGRLVLPGAACEILRNHDEALRDPERFDRDLILQRTGPHAIPDHLHYQAAVIEVMDRVRQDGELLPKMLWEIAGCISGDAPHTSWFALSRERDKKWVTWLMTALTHGMRIGPQKHPVAPDALLLGVYHGAVTRYILDRVVTA